MELFNKPYEIFVTHCYCKCGHCVLEHEGGGCSLCGNDCKLAGKELYKNFKSGKFEIIIAGD